MNILRMVVLSSLTCQKNKLRHLDLHRGLHDGGARVVVFGLRFSFVRATGLSAACAEDESVVAILQHVD